MAIKMKAKVCLLLLSQLLVQSVDAGSWQSCRQVSVEKCGVGDSGSGDHEYRYDIGAYRYKWTRNPLESTRYRGPFQHVRLSQLYRSCQVCSNETKPTQGGPTQNPSQLATTSDIMIVDNNIGKLGNEKAEILSQVPCGRYCRLWFVGCNLTEIEGGAFAELPQVSTLVIWRSNVQTLRNGTFAGMEDLEYLLLLENNLTQLEDGCFDGLPSLSFLILVDNQILTLSPDTFRGVRPRWLDVSANRMSNVAPGTLQAIKSVEHIRAVENKLRAIGAGMFHGLERLKVLMLQGNKISHIAAGAFHSNKMLSVLNLAGNRLTFLTGGWFKSSFPFTLFVRRNAIAAMALEGRALKSRRVMLDDPPRCTCANDWLFDPEGNSSFTLKQRFVSALRMPSTASCPAWSLMMQNPPAPVAPSALPCPLPLVEIASVERDAAHKYKVVGSVHWEQLPRLSCAFPNGSQHALNITYDTNTTTHARLPTGNLTATMMTDLKAEGWVRCKGPVESPFGGSGNHSQCSNYMGKTKFTLWLESTQPLSFGNTTCTASSGTDSHTAVFMAIERGTHSGITTTQATEPPLMNTTPFSTNISTTPLPTCIPTTPLPASKSDDGYGDLTWYIVFAAIGLSSPVAALGVWGCVSCIKRRLRRKVPENDAGPNRNGDHITACSRWPVGDHGDLDESVISPYAEGGFEDHDSLKESESVISPYADGGFADHPDLCRAGSSQSEVTPYGEGKLCAAYAGRARAQTHPIPSRPYSTERPRHTPNREGAVVAAYGHTGSDNPNDGKSAPNCYRHPVILPNPGATRSSAYQQNARAAQGSRKAPCYNSPALATDQERALSSTYDQRDPREAAKRSPKATCYKSLALATDQERTLSSTYDQHDPREAAKSSPKAPCYNSPALATDQERTLSSTYDQHDPREAAKRSRKAPCYNSPTLATDQERTLSSTYDHQDPRGAAKSSRKAPCYNSPALTTDKEHTLTKTYDQHDPSEAVCNSAESPMANSYQPATLPSSETGAQSAIYDENHRRQPTTGRGDSYVCPFPAASADRSPAAAYSQNDRREAINDTPESPETNSYEPASADG
ncbi:uncharacterized protein LOC144861954 [Branchiostoma floridae x Branchiostoma japonicum]